MHTDGQWRTRSLLAMVICAVGLLAAPTAAQQRPCQQDLEKLCPNMKPGTPQARQCLKENLDKLSEPCRQRINSARGRQGYPPRFKDCEKDLEKFCKDTMSGGGRLVKCLREHETEISPECKKNLPSGRGGGGPKGGGGGSGGGRGGGGGGGGRGNGQSGGSAAAQPTVQAK